jgi:TolA-binding protein
MCGGLIPVKPLFMRSGLSVLLAAIFITGCATEAGQERMKKDIADLKGEVARLSARQDAMEQDLARKTAKEKEQAAKAPAQQPPKAEPRPQISSQAPLAIPMLPVVKVSEPKPEAAKAAPVVEVRETETENPEIQGAVQPDSTEDPGKVFNKGMRQFAENDCGNAVVTFEDFLRLAPSHPKAPQALINIGECYYKRGEFAIALSEYTRLEQLFQDSKLVPKALYKAGMCLKNLKDPKGARETFQRLIKEYPGDPAAAMAQKELAHLK